MSNTELRVSANAYRIELDTSSELYTTYYLQHNGERIAKFDNFQDAEDIAFKLNNEWCNDMSLAPKDGTSLLVVTAAGTVKEAYYGLAGCGDNMKERIIENILVRTEFGEEPTELDWYLANDSCECCHDEIEEPTHWKHITPPKEK